MSTKDYKQKPVDPGSDGDGTDWLVDDLKARLAAMDDDRPKPKYCCPQCGCTEIQIAAWVNANTNEIEDGDGPIDDVWCPDCEEDVGHMADVGTAEDPKRTQR